MKQLVLLLFTLVTPSETVFADSSLIPRYEVVYKKLERLKVPKAFIQKLREHPEIEFKEYALKANTLGFLRKLDHSHLVSEDGEQQCRQLISQNQETAQFCSQKYKVPAEVIASLLWIETKHGRDLGKHHLASVFMSIASASTQESQKYLDEQLLMHFEGKKSKDYRIAKHVLNAQIKKKSHWALGELRSLSKIWSAPKKFGVDPLEWKGSISGAFGISQFLPSSYLLWSADGNQDGKVDLFTVSDALCSVGRYLKLSGWKTQNVRSRQKAIYRYNNSSDYVASVLKLADRVSLNGQIATRKTASQTDAPGAL